MNKKRWLYLFIVMIFVLCSFVFFKAGSYLVINDSPEKADLIICLSGDKGQRTIHAVDLYQQNYAPKILFSGGNVYDDITMAQLMAEHAQKLGVPKEAVIIEKRANSTYQNALFCKEMLRGKDISSIIIVSSDYHMRRVQLTYSRVFADTNIKLIYSATKDPYFNETKWWSNNKSLLYTATEYLKLLGYLLGRAA